MRYFLAFMLLAFPAIADDAESRITCDETKCIVMKSDLASLLRANEEWSQRADRAEAQLKELRSRICASKWM